MAECFSEGRLEKSNKCDSYSCELSSGGRNDLVQQTRRANICTLTEEPSNVGQERRPNGCRAGYFLAQRDKLLSLDKTKGTLTLSKKKKGKDKSVSLSSTVSSMIIIIII